MSYVRQVPKFLQAHAHLLGKGAVASLAGPEGATLVQDVDSDKDDDLDHDDGVRHTSCMLKEAPLASSQDYLSSQHRQSAFLAQGMQQIRLLCLMQGALQRAVAENPELAQQEPALLKLANKVTHISTFIHNPPLS